MTQDRNSSSAQGAQADVGGLSKEAIDNIKHSILFGVGYQRPPEHTRFKKGQSGNPNGRPKKDKSTMAGERSANALALREAEREIPVRQGGENCLMKTIDAIYRARSAAALKGNAYPHTLEVMYSRIARHSSKCNLSTKSNSIIRKLSLRSSAEAKSRFAYCTPRAPDKIYQCSLKMSFCRI